MHTYTHGTYIHKPHGRFHAGSVRFIYLFKKFFLADSLSLSVLFNPRFATNLVIHVNNLLCILPYFSPCLLLYTNVCVCI